MISCNNKIPAINTECKNINIDNHHLAPSVKILIPPGYYIEFIDAEPYLVSTNIIYAGNNILKAIYHRIKNRRNKPLNTLKNARIALKWFKNYR